MSRGVGAILVAVVVIAIVANLGPGDDPPESETRSGGYQSEYGGSAEVYARIAGKSDCDELQAEFEVAAANNEAAEPGTPQHKKTLGYMTAAQDRREALGC